MKKLFITEFIHFKTLNKDLKFLSLVYQDILLGLHKNSQKYLYYTIDHSSNSIKSNSAKIEMIIAKIQYVFFKGLVPKRFPIAESHSKRKFLIPFQL